MLDSNAAVLEPDATMLITVHAHGEADINALPSSMLQALSELSDAELGKLEDDLDCFAFTGMRSKRVEAILTHL